MDFKEILEQLSFSEDLSPEIAESALQQIMSGDIPNEQIASFLTALRIKGETHQEITAFVKVMRKK
jgi:anthranilate phosphoribosyltransferase